MFGTEFTIKMQTGREEESYFDKIHEILSSLIADEDKINGRLFDVEYIPTKKANRICFYWNIPKSIVIPSKETWEPKGVYRNCASPKEGIELECVKSMEKALSKIKWFRKRNINDFATIWM